MASDERRQRINNNVCRNFNYNKKDDSTLEIISFNCERCEFDGHCVIQTEYYNAKDYRPSIMWSRYERVLRAITKY